MLQALKQHFFLMLFKQNIVEIILKHYLSAKMK